MLCQKIAVDHFAVNPCIFRLCDPPVQTQVCQNGRFGNGQRCLDASEGTTTRRHGRLLDMLQRSAAAQKVIGNAEKMIRLVIRKCEFEYTLQSIKSFLQQLNGIDDDVPRGSCVGNRDNGFSPELEGSQ